jgi:hypothetical protein
MAEEHAGIYWPEEPEAEFYRLPVQSQRRLADFMEQQRAALEQSEGGEQHNLADVWQRCWAVSWFIQLRPPYQGHALPQSPSGPLGRYYRIAVLRVWQFC